MAAIAHKFHKALLIKVKRFNRNSFEFKSPRGKVSSREVRIVNIHMIVAT